MKIFGIRWFSGLALAATLSGAVVLLITLSGRENSALLASEATNLSEREAKLLNQLSVLALESSMVASLPPEVVWSKGSDASVEIVMHQELVAAAEGAGLMLISLGQAPAETKLKSPSVAYALELTGSHEGLGRFLASIEAMRPRLAISYLWIRQLPPSQEEPGSPVSIRMTVWGFREQEAPP